MENYKSKKALQASSLKLMCQAALSITLWNDVGWLKQLLFYCSFINIITIYIIIFVYVKRGQVWERIQRGKTELHQKFIKTQSKTFCHGWEGKIYREREWERATDREGARRKKMLPFFAWCIKASELTALHCLDLGFLHSPSKAL